MPLISHKQYTTQKILLWHRICIFASLKSDQTDLIHSTAVFVHLLFLFTALSSPVSNREGRIVSRWWCANCQALIQLKYVWIEYSLMHCHRLIDSLCKMIFEIGLRFVHSTETKTLKSMHSCLCTWFLLDL